MRYLKLFDSFDLIEESRRWISDSIKTQIENFINKYKGQEDRIFVSYRSGEYVSFINPKNEFNTPTGIYTYPWRDYLDKRFDEIKKSALPEYKKLVPFTGMQKSNFIYLYKVKDSAFLIDNSTTYEEILPYAKKLQSIFGEDELLKKYLISEEDYVSSSNNTYLKGNVCGFCSGELTYVCPECQGEGYPSDEEGEYECDYCYGTGEIECEECEDGLESEYEERTSAHIFWVLIHDLIHKTKVKGRPQTRFANICNRIGVDGFVDLGDGYIHPNEKYQAVIFKGRSVTEDYVSIPLDVDMQTIQLANSMMDADNKGLSEIFEKIFRRFSYLYSDSVQAGIAEDEYFSKISRYMKSENKLYQFIENAISNSKGEKNILRGLKKLIKNLLEDEQNMIKNKFVELK